MRRVEVGPVVFLFALSTGCTTSVAPETSILSVEEGPLAPARESWAYAETLSVSGGKAPYEWSLASRGDRLPPGLDLSVDGEIAGTPQSAGEWDFAVTVRSSDRGRTHQDLSITVWPSAAPVLDPAKLCSDYPGWSLATFEDPDLARAVGGPATCDELEHLRVVQSIYSDTIRSLVGLQNLPELAHLDLTFTRSIHDIEPLRDLEHLYNVFMTGNAIGDLGPLAGHDELLDLRLAYNAIHDLRGLTDLPELKYLDLGHNQIADITALAGLTALTTLVLWHNDISDVSALAALTQLRGVELGGNSVTDITPLSGLPGLIGLGLDANGISDVSGLRDFTGLQGLSLQDNGITDISALADLTALVNLFLNGNALSNIEPLRALESLTDLRLGQNALTDIAPLAGLTNIRSLELDDNEITDLSALVGLTKLAYLDLSGNAGLADIQPLLDNPGLPVHTLYVDGFDLRGTSVACSDIAALEARGVYVMSDCP